jgi:hypothetical protein
MCSAGFSFSIDEVKQIGGVHPFVVQKSLQHSTSATEEVYSKIVLKRWTLPPYKMTTNLI